MNQNAPPTGRRLLVIGSLTSGHAISFSIIITIGLLLPYIDLRPGPVSIGTGCVGRLGNPGGPLPEHTNSLDCIPIPALESR